MLFLKRYITAIYVVVAYAQPLSHRDVLFDYDKQTIRGVNIGGLFLLEPWITPSIFTSANDAVDEFQFSTNLGQEEAQRRLVEHWSSFYTEADFAEMASYGLNHVRLGVGYWIYNPIDGEPYITGVQIQYIDQMIRWAGTHGLKVMLDLHGAPGSQNGFDNSGRLGNVEWQQGQNVDHTLATLDIMAKKYLADSEFSKIVTALCVINEPASFKGLDMGRVKDFYKSAYDIVRKYNTETVVTLSDAFLTIADNWNGFMSPQDGINGVQMDTHLYQVFVSDLLHKTPCEHVQAACAGATGLKASDKWAIVGEWSAAMTDCTKWLNGYNTGARYDNTFTSGYTDGYIASCQGLVTGTIDELPAQLKSETQHYIEAQLDAYEARSGWIFWTWKTESAPLWDYRALTRGGLMPNPITTRNLPSQCGVDTCAM